MFAGLDLAASPRRCSGYALIGRGRRLLKLLCLRRDEEIVAELGADSPVIVAVDAPLSMPQRGAFREVDRLLIARGGRVLPPVFKGMARLVERAQRLVGRLKAMGLRIVETHPMSALRLSGCPNALRLAEELGIGYSGFETVLRSGPKDLVDAFISAVVAMCVEEGCSLSVKGADGEIVVLRRVCRR